MYVCMCMCDCVYMYIYFCIHTCFSLDTNLTDLKAKRSSNQLMIAAIAIKVKLFNFCPLQWSKR